MLEMMNIEAFRCSEQLDNVCPRSGTYFGALFPVKTIKTNKNSTAPKIAGGLHAVYLSDFMDFQKVLLAPPTRVIGWGEVGGRVGGGGLVVCG